MRRPFASSVEKGFALGAAMGAGLVGGGVAIEKHNATMSMESDRRITDESRADLAKLEKDQLFKIERTLTDLKWRQSELKNLQMDLVFSNVDKHPKKTPEDKKARINNLEKFIAEDKTKIQALRDDLRRINAQLAESLLTKHPELQDWIITFARTQRAEGAINGIESERVSENPPGEEPKE